MNHQAWRSRPNTSAAPLGCLYMHGVYKACLRRDMVLAHHDSLHHGRKRPFTLSRCIALLLCTLPPYARAAPLGDTLTIGPPVIPGPDIQKHGGRVATDGDRKNVDRGDEKAKWHFPGVRYSYSSTTTLIGARESTMLIDAVVSTPIRVDVSFRTAIRIQQGARANSLVMTFLTKLKSE